MAHAFGSAPSVRRNPAPDSRHRVAGAGLAPVRGAVLPLAAMLLAGCKLIDQTSFAPRAEPPTPAQIAAQAAPPVRRPALLTIRFSSADIDYVRPLTVAVGIAEQRRPGSEYDVIAAIPVERDPAAQSRQVALAERNAAEVLREMVRLGIPDQRIRLGAVSDPSIGVREVRVYLR